jgi:predicted ArsR family transcriptional regulator
LTTPLLVYYAIGIVNYPTTPTTDHSTGSTRERVAWLLASGLTVREVAAVLGVTTQAVYKHIHRYDLKVTT